MDSEQQAQAASGDAVGAPVQREVRPVAEVQLMGSVYGEPYYGCLLSTQDAQRIGKGAPLYDQAALDAAMAAEHERMRDLCLIDMARATLKASELAQAAERERFIDALADACIAAEIPDSKLESLLIALRA